MKNTIKLKEVIRSLDYLKDQYSELSNDIIAQINTNEITEATENLGKLKDLKESIDKIENVNVESEEYMEIWRNIP